MNILTRNITIVLAPIAFLWLLLFLADIYDIPPPPVTEYDERIVSKTIDLLNQQHTLNKKDDRSCIDETVLSLYCALVKSSLSVAGTFNHNSAALEQVRKEILVFSSRNDYAHILMDFNNSPDVSLDDAQTVLRRAKASLNKQWEERNEILDWFSEQVRALQSN